METDRLTWPLHSFFTGYIIGPCILHLAVFHVSCNSFFVWSLSVTSFPFESLTQLTPSDMFSLDLTKFVLQHSTHRSFLLYLFLADKLCLCPVTCQKWTETGMVLFSEQNEHCCEWIFATRNLLKPSHYCSYGIPNQFGCSFVRNFSC